MVYRDALTSAHGRLAALEADVARDVARHNDELRIARDDSRRRERALCDERERMRAALESSQQVERELARRQLDLARARAMCCERNAEARLGQATAALRHMEERAMAHQAEVDALLAGPEAARVYYIAAIATLRAAIAAAGAEQERLSAALRSTSERVALLEAAIETGGPADAATLSAEAARVQAERETLDGLLATAARRCTSDSRELERLDGALSRSQRLRLLQR